MNHPLTDSIPDTDWSATPVTVQKILLSLEQERNILREQLERIKQESKQETIQQTERIQRYHSLVEQQFLSGLTREEQAEIEYLGKEIDEVNSAFYPSLDSLSETIGAQAGQKVK